jgi:hypothetical protein
MSMVKKYIFVRLPTETYGLYKNIKVNMEMDLKKMTGKPLKLPMTKVFKAVASPSLNENYIQVDLNKLKKYARSSK